MTITKPNATQDEMAMFVSRFKIFPFQSSFYYQNSNTMKAAKILTQSDAFVLVTISGLPIMDFCQFQHYTALKYKYQYKFQMDPLLPKQRDSHYQKSLEDAISEHSFSLAKEKVNKKSKKESLKDKKQLKNKSKQLCLNNHPQNEQQLHKSKSDEDNSATNEPITHASKTVRLASINNQAFSFNRLILKPPYVYISSDGRIGGSFGHSTAIFKRPIIEGLYFLEVLVRQNCRKDKKITYKPAVRVGICHRAFNYSFPLGYEESVAYKGSDGTFVKNGEKIGSGEAYAAGDVIGVLLKISPLNKYPKPQELSMDSSVSFFKNGMLMLEYKDLRQVFYCFAVSLFNYSQAQVLPGPNSKYPMPQEAKHYYTVLNEEIPYKDLQNNKIFKI